MDAVYLQKEVGTALAKGLAAVTAAQPYDPVEYLAKWLLQYVQNQDQEKLRDKQALQLEEEKKQHAEALEWERIRLEQEEQAKKEAIRAAELAKEQVQLDLVQGFEDKVSQREEFLLQQEGSNTPQQQLVRPLSNLQEKLQVIVNELDSNNQKVTELFKARGITAGDHPLALLLKATIVLVGWSQLSELSDWNDCKKLLRNPDLQVEIKKFSPLKRQTINKFTSAFHLVKDYPIEEAKKTNYVIYLIWQWVTTNVNTRKAALVVKSERLNIPIINDPSSEFNEDNDDDEEEDLEEELHRSEMIVKEAEAKERQQKQAAEQREEEANEEEEEEREEAEGDEEEDEEDDGEEAKEDEDN